MSGVVSEYGKLTATGTPPAVVPSVSQRYRAPGLLCLGSVAATCAFLGTFGVTLAEFRYNKSSFVLGADYPSGYGYWPPTVSESVHNRVSPAGKIFFTGCLVSAVLYLISFYPYALRNVYTGPELVPGGCCYCTTMRQYMPGLGLLMLIGVSTYPTAQAATVVGANLCIVLHLVGAGMMFTGYMGCEWECLQLPPLNKNKSGQAYLSIEGGERHIRTVTIVTMFCCYNVFIVCTVLLLLPASAGLCCYDEWYQAGEWYNRTSPSGITEVHILQKAEVWNTASGSVLLIKMASYFSEVIAGLALIASHFVVWYYCEERKVQFGDSYLEMVYDDRDADEL